MGSKMAVELNNFTSADELEIAITGPNDANRLFIYSGIVEVARHSGDETMDRFSAFIDLSTKHNRNFLPSPRTVAAPVAYLASLHGTDDAEDCTWAIDNVSTDLTKGKLIVLLDLAVQGEDDDFNRLAYHVSVRTLVPLELAGVILYPPNRVIHSGNVGFVQAVLSAPAPQGGYK